MSFYQQLIEFPTRRALELEARRRWLTERIMLRGCWNYRRLLKSERVFCDLDFY